MKFGSAFFGAGKNIPQTILHMTQNIKPIVKSKQLCSQIFINIATHPLF